jgi:hypothetical protein
MSPRGTRQTSVHKVYGDKVSPDDVAARLNEAAAREATDDRSEAERWLGDPPANRSALAAKLPARK